MIAKIQKQPKCPLMDKWENKMWYMHTIEYYSPFKNKKILQNATIWMNQKDIC